MRTALLLSMLLLSMLLLACNEPEGTTRVDFRRPRPAGTPGPAVARYAGDALTAAEVQARFDEMNPYARARFQTVEQRKEYVEGLARFDLLALEAVRQGLAKDPEVVEAARRVMVQQLLKRELEEKVSDITDAQVKAYYEQHVGDYKKPAMVRLAHIAFDKAHRAQAEALLAQVRALQPLDFAAFGALARQHSEDEATKPLEGDLRYQSDEELTQRYGEALAVAGQALKQVGEVSPALVETAKALHIVKLQGRQVALNLSVEEAKPSIQSVLMNETKQERFKALVDRLKTSSGFTLDEAAIAALVVDPKRPSVPAKGPQPGYVPAPAGAVGR